MKEPRIRGSLPLLWLGVLLALAPGGSLAKETAFVEVVLFESSPNGDYKTHTTELQGRFSRAGATISAEGEIVQQMKNRNSKEQFFCGVFCFPPSLLNWIAFYILHLPCVGFACLSLSDCTKVDVKGHDNRMALTLTGTHGAK